MLSFGVFKKMACSVQVGRFRQYQRRYFFFHFHLFSQIFQLSTHQLKLFSRSSIFLFWKIRYFLYFSYFLDLSRQSSVVMLLRSSTPLTNSSIFRHIFFHLFLLSRYGSKVCFISRSELDGIQILSMFQIGTKKKSFRASNGVVRCIIMLRINQVICKKI